MTSNSAIPAGRSTDINMLKPHQSPLQMLLQIGFPKHRAEKALAATGNQSAEIATNWLLSHVNDPFLDENSPREYILYVCPKGPFSEQLNEFWDKSLNVHGRNGAHNFTPHITLVSFFKTTDEHAPYLAKCLESVMERDGAVLNEPFKLEVYTSRNFMGFFVAEEHADYLKRIAMQYVKEVSNAIISDTYEHFDALTACFPWCTTTTARCIPRGSRSISHEPHAKSLHLTLAYQFPNNQFDGLKALIDELDPNATAEWELRLYSRDPRLNGKQVYKVIREYIPTETDDLELKIGDYLYASSEALNSSTTDGWLEGTSWTTGCSGYFLESYTCRVPESDAWTLHKSVSLNKCEQLKDMAYREDLFTKPQVKKFMKDRIIADLKDVVTTTKNTRASDANQRNIFVLRHAERVDFVFGQWVPHCFDEAGNYLRKDLNLPASIPPRETGPQGYSKDGPITNVGSFHAKSIGEVFKSNEVKIDYVYCSPSFRCVQTLDALLQGLGKKDDIKIRVEPCLFEWTLWYPDVPSWMSLEELAKAGYNIDTTYKSFKNVRDIKAKEPIENFYSRSADFSRKVMEDHPTGNILLVGHSATLDTTTRHLIDGKGARSKDDLFGLIGKIPYCSLVQITEEGNKWKFVDPPCPPMTYCVNHRFDWKVLLSD